MLHSISEIRGPEIRFRELTSADRRIFQSANDVLSVFLQKVVGIAVEDQAAYLSWNIKKLFKGTSYLNFIFADFESLKDYSTLTRAERKNYGR